MCTQRTIFADICKLIRLPNLLMVVIFQCSLRYGMILPYLGSHGVTPNLTTTQFVLLVVASVCLAAGGNAINDYFDMATDRINRPNRVVVGTTIERRDALLTHVILTLTGIFAGLYVSFILRRASFMLLYLLIPVVLWFYSTTFKKRMLVGNVVVALLVSLTGYMVISTEYAAIDRSMGDVATSVEPFSHLWYVTCAYCFFAFITNLAREIIKDMEDIEGDKETNCQTLPVELGIERSKIVVSLLEVFFIVTLWVCYCSSSTLQSYNWSIPYIGLCLTLPSIALTIVTWRAHTPKEFHKASTLSKIIMLLGLLTILF